MLSSSIDPADITRAKSYSDVSGYLIKPVKLEDLMETLGQSE